MSAIKDFLGNEIVVGDEIVYAASVGRSPVLVHARVVETRPEHFVERDKRRSYGAKCPIVVEPLARLYETYAKNPSKRIALMFPERCLVVRK